MLFGSFLFFTLFFLSAILIVAMFLYLYAIVTPYDDYKLIFQENNSAAAIGFGGAIVGLCIPLYSALVSSVSYVDFIIWATVAMIIQLLFALIITRVKSRFSFEKLINDGLVSAGILMAFLSISIGLLNAGSMSY
ncbi:MAG: DUF350 domain-containing protein [Sulfurimonas sp.]|jgi:putative membrane protein|uniref:DUF350 domain-containing protein n=1 Tax=Sulfurimonas sp. TaxID=2022749 RepID=UPI00262385F2|nr:DUF350 domain-containing protein [Sulfurimonas sp.]MDD3476074.1 DUF350 domain-containing protein [Sulfurimonas sp.]HUH42470.1 DUF350 domain-containing protein [Sulfurimonas sp.]